VGSIGIAPGDGAQQSTPTLDAGQVFSIGAEREAAPASLFAREREQEGRAFAREPPASEPLARPSPS
jgi:hypothetical protein